MNADSDFKIGHGHLVCQDYATTCVGKDCACAILSDGCSASPDVDIGARVLTLSAKWATVVDNSIGTDHNYTTFGKICIQNAARIFEILPHLHPQALDATLLVAWVKENVLTAYIYGDGVFFHKSSTGLYALRVELDTGAPDYLSYTIDPARKREYDTIGGGTKKVEIHDENGKGYFEYKPFSPVIVTRKVQAGDIVAVCSDGINSFRRADDSSIEWLELAEEFIGYKTFSGIFVKRRFAAFKKKCLKEGWTHGDDISVAAIVI